MTRAALLATAFVLVSVPAGQAQGPWLFRWQTGQALTYRVEQSTAAIEVIDGRRSETTTQMRVVKRWQVQAVDAAGVATVQKVVTSLRLQTTLPTGSVLLYDSADPEKSDPQMREQLGKFVGQPNEVLRVDAYGRVVEVKECKHGMPSRFESDLPFVLSLPAAAIGVGQAWERTYRITLEPPHGTGEKFDASQKYVCKAIAGNVATLSMTTEVKKLPEAVGDQVPLVPLMPEGEITFDTQSGAFRSARLRTEKELTGHQGEGSSYKYTSTYVEERVP